MRRWGKWLLADGFCFGLAAPRTTIATALACHLTCIWLLAGKVHALDPNKRLIQYETKVEL
jgi:hypothetical protein